MKVNHLNNLIPPNKAKFVPEKCRDCMIPAASDGFVSGLYPAATNGKIRNQFLEDFSHEAKPSGTNVVDKTVSSDKDDI